MEDANQQAETSLSKFSHALDQVEQTLRPVLKSLDELRASGNEEDLDAMSRARMHISLAYAVNTLFCMYLRTQGVDPATHPVSDEIGRVQEAFMRIRKVEAGLSVDHQRPPDRDRRRHYENMRKTSQKLAGLIFPEEVDLLNALRGKKRKMEAENNEKEKKIRKKEREFEQQSEGESNSSIDHGNSNHQEGSQRHGGTIEQRDTAKREHATDSSEEENEREKTNEPDERNADKTTVRKKKRKSKSDGGAEVHRDKNKTKDKRSKKEKKNKKSKEKEDVTDQQSKTSARSEQKRKRKKKMK